jgi:hypothetical protein
MNIAPDENPFKNVFLFLQNNSPVYVDKSDDAGDQYEALSFPRQGQVAPRIQVCAGVVVKRLRTCKRK